MHFNQLELLHNLEEHAKGRGDGGYVPKAKVP